MPGSRSFLGFAKRRRLTQILASQPVVGLALIRRGQVQNARTEILGSQPVVGLALIRRGQVQSAKTDLIVDSRQPNWGTRSSQELSEAIAKRLTRHLPMSAPIEPLHSSRQMQSSD